MKTYYVKVRGNKFGNQFINDCSCFNWSVWKVKIRFNKTKKNLELYFPYSWNIEEDPIPEFINGKKVLDDWAFDCECQKEDNLKW